MFNKIVGGKQLENVCVEIHRPQFLSQCSLGKDSSALAGPAAALQHSGSIPTE